MCVYIYIYIYIYTYIHTRVKHYMLQFLIFNCLV